MSMCTHMSYDRPAPTFYILWPEAPYSITVPALSSRNLFVTFGIPLLSPHLSITI